MRRTQKDFVRRVNENIGFPKHLATVTNIGPGFVQLSTKLIRKQWIEPELEKYYRMDGIRRAMAHIAEEKDLNLEKMYEHLVWPIEDAGIEFFYILARVILALPTSKS